MPAKRKNINWLGRKSALHLLGEDYLSQRYPQREATTPARPKRTKKTGSVARDSEGWGRAESEKALRRWKKMGYNPAECATMLKEHVTDRAKRYRAHQPACLPDGPKKCALCPSKRFVTVDHKDGNESNGAKSNLRWLCKSCNAKEGARMAREGKGRRTQQYNPTKQGGASNLYEYALAGQMHERGKHDAGGLIIHRTPKSKRKEFAADAWAARKAHGNPEDSAASLAESWHGRPAKSATDYIERVHFHGVLTDLGRLKELSVMVSARKKQKIFFDKETRLCSSENGKQLYIVGGDQSLDLGALGIRGEEAAKDLVWVGEAYSVVYVTSKEHLGKLDAIPGPYEHVLGEDGGTPPMVVYDRMNDAIGFAGGSYFIDATDYDGQHSRGIRN